MMKDVGIIMAGALLTTSTSINVGVPAYTTAVSKPEEA